jgi:hypothetical protein
MNITKEKCDEFKGFVEGLLGKYYMPSQRIVDHRCLLPELFEYATQISENHIPPRFIHGENTTGVNSTQFDFDMLMMSIMSICWG